MFLTENHVSCETNRVNYDWGQFSCYDLNYEYKNEKASEVTTYLLPKHELEKYLKDLRNNKKQTNLNKKYMVK